MSSSPPPPDILILGAGVFGLSTALSLTRNPSYSSTRITLVDQFSPESAEARPSPNPSASSIDTSRIIRSDYADPAYSSLALSSQRHWRSTSPTGWGGEGRYHESGFLLTADPGKEGYVRMSLKNVRQLAETSGGEVGPVEEVTSKAEIDSMMGCHGMVSGSWGYMNRGSGWADAEAAVMWALSQLDRERVDVRKGRVEKLLFDNSSSTRRVMGAQLSDGSAISAKLTILATGAWTPLLIDLRGRATSTGQVLGYIDLTLDEQRALQNIPVMMNLSSGMFVLPPWQGMLKVARHGFGYRNPKQISIPNAGDNKTCQTMEISVPEVGLIVPHEGQQAMRDFLQQLFPPTSIFHDIAERPFAKTRVCWYTDTPSGDFLIDFHPDFGRSLLIATGGSGHAFKFFPVLGQKIVERMEDKLEQDNAEMWKWRDTKTEEAEWATEDGSRSGRREMVLIEEMSQPKLE